MNYSMLISEGKRRVANFIKTSGNIRLPANKIWMLLLILVVILSTVAKLIYVFKMTHYQNYLSTDMGGYWYRAQQLYDGDIFNINQWVIWPPLFHIVMANLYKVINFVGLGAYELEAILTINILLSSLAVYYLYKITQAIFKNHLASILVAFTYGFSYMMIYLNAFILSENMAIPLLIISIWYLYKGSKRQQIISALLLAIATGMRPGYGLLGLPFVLYTFINKETFWQRVYKCAIFSITYFAIIFLLLAHNNYISSGRMSGLSASNGINFFFAFTKAYGVRSNFNGYYYVIHPPSTCDKPENGVLETTVPIYDSEFFRKNAIKYIKDNPKVLITKWSDLKELFFGNMMPWMGDAKWFNTMRRPFQWYMFIMAVFSLLVLVQLKNQKIDRRKLMLLLSVPVFSVLVNYMYNTEYRYLFSFAFVIHVTFFATLIAAIKDFQLFKKPLMGLASATAAGVLIAILINGDKEVLETRNIKATFARNQVKIDSINQPRDIYQSLHTYIDILEINRDEKRQVYYDLINNGYYTQYFIDFETNLKVLIPGYYEIIMEGNNGFELYIDGNLIHRRQYGPAFDNTPEFKSKIWLNMGKGTHRIRIAYHESINHAKLLAYYKPVMDVTGMQYYFGSNTKFIQFEPVTE